MARLTLNLFGSPHITLDGRPAAHFAYNKVRALLIYLAVESERPHPREALVGLLWPDLPDGAARTNLRQALANLREAIDDAHADPPYLCITREAIQFNAASDHALDVSTFDALFQACDAHVHRGLDRCSACAARLARALELYTADFLVPSVSADSAPFEEWALLRRERWRQQALEGLAALSSYQERQGNLEVASRFVRRQLELDTWREEAHRQLMRLLAQSGQRSAALAQYETCRRVLATEFGVEPTAQTRSLYERIRDQSEPAPSAPGPRDLPAATGPLIGREEELAQLGDWLAVPSRRLITIVGPGGIGKTRLAQVVTAREAATFRDGAAFVPLAPLDSVEFLAPAIIDALNVTPQSRPEPARQLLSYLRDKELLLVLDNYEHLLPSTELLSEIMRRAPGVTLLVTSRERLALSAEWLCELGGLPYPPETESVTAGEPAAVRLFVERARQLQPSFSPGMEEAPAVARICRLVEGLPLALELAAGLVPRRSCTLIAAELETGLQALVTALRDVPERHRSLAATFAQSWRLLVPAEAIAFGQLSVFRGGFQAEAAQQVAGASESMLQALLDKSLLRRDHAGRYGLHELLRQYGAEKLRESGEVQLARTRHLDYYLSLAEESEQYIYGPSQAFWLNRLATEHDNLRAAFAWSMEQRKADAALRLAVALYHFSYVRGYLREGYTRLQQALALGPAEPTALRARALNSAGFLAYRLGQYAEARSLYDQALAAGRAIGNEHSIASSLSNLGTLARVRGDLEGAVGLLDESLALRLKQGDQRDIATALNNLAIALRESGAFARAQALLQQNLQLRRALGDAWGIAAGLKNLGDVVLDQGDRAGAVALYEESLAAFRSVDDRRSIAITLKSLGDISCREGQPARARERYVEALALLDAAGDQPGIESTLRALADAEMAEQQVERAALLWGAAQAVREALDTPVPPGDRAASEHKLAAARAQLGDAVFQSLWAEGRALAPGAALEVALARSQAPNLNVN